MPTPPWRLKFAASPQRTAEAPRRAQREGVSMIAVIFEVWPKPGHKQRYLDLAAELRPLLDTIDGFISIERFESLYEPGKMLSLSFFRDEAAVSAWRNLEAHRHAQALGRSEIFSNYRLRIAGVIRDYGMSDRAQVPADSRSKHG
jgi:heme-degrading monooxygenase HmoA